MSSPVISCFVSDGSFGVLSWRDLSLRLFLSLSLFVPLSLHRSYYQNALSSIFVYQKLFPDTPDVSFTQILLSTLPESIPTVLLYIFGLHRTKWLGFTARVHLSAAIFLISAIVYIVGIYTAPTADTLLSIIYAVTVAGAVGQFLVEPALYEVSGIVPTVSRVLSALCAANGSFSLSLTHTHPLSSLYYILDPSSQSLIPKTRAEDLHAICHSRYCVLRRRELGHSSHHPSHLCVTV